MDIESTLQAILDRQLVIYRRLVLLDDKGKRLYNYINAERHLQDEVKELKKTITKSDAGIPSNE